MMVSRGSSAVEQLIRNQQAVGSNPTSGSILLLVTVIIIGLIGPSGALYGELGGSYQRIYRGAAYVSVEPQLTIPDDISLNLKGGFVFYRRLLMELIIGVGNVPFPAAGTYFGTRMFYRILIDHYSVPGVSIIIGANNRNKVGIDVGFELSKRFGNFSIYLGLINKALVTPDNKLVAQGILIPGVEVGLSRVSFVSMEAGWSLDSDVSIIALSYLVAIY